MVLKSKRTNKNFYKKGKRTIKGGWFKFGKSYKSKPPELPQQHLKQNVEPKPEQEQITYMSPQTQTPTTTLYSYHKKPNNPPITPVIMNLSRKVSPGPNLSLQYKAIKNHEQVLSDASKKLENLTRHKDINALNAQKNIEQYGNRLRLLRLIKSFNKNNKGKLKQRRNRHAEQKKFNNTARIVEAIRLTSQTPSPSPPPPPPLPRLRGTQTSIPTNSNRTSTNGYQYVVPQNLQNLQHIYEKT